MPVQLTTDNFWVNRQRRLNDFTSQYLKGVTQLRVDGVPGPATLKRIKHVKWWLGYKQPYGSKWTNQLDKMLRHPYYKVLSSPATVARGLKRRRAHNRWVRKHQRRPAAGVGTFDGVPCATWLMPYLQWARNHGWPGRLVSGWRDPAYSERLCFAMCGRPSCPGKCAGRSSHHSGSLKPNGAVDVTFYTEFGHIIAGCPFQPRIFNNLPADRVHFSAQGN
jgi:hypothetical protein